METRQTTENEGSVEIFETVEDDGDTKLIDEDGGRSLMKGRMGWTKERWTDSITSWKE